MAMTTDAVVPDLGSATAIQVVPLAVVDPGVRRKGADGEPNEARGSEEHRVIESVVSVPEQVVWGHARKTKTKVVVERSRGAMCVGHCGSSMASG